MQDKIYVNYTVVFNDTRYQVGPYSSWDEARNHKNDIQGYDGIVDVSMTMTYDPERVNPEEKQDVRLG